MIPKETTDAYKNAFDPEIVVIKGLSHSLDDASEKQIIDYHQVLFNWLKDV